MDLGATKRLMRALRGKGVEISRARKAAYNRTLVEGSIPRKEYNYIDVPKGAPIAQLWHEAGHHVARRADELGADKIEAMRRALRDQGVTGRVHDSVEIAGKLRRERNANRAALKVMNRLGVSAPMQEKFKKAATKGYGTYRNQPFVKEVVPAGDLKKKAWDFSVLTPGMIQF